ncbi:hypothetical protein ASE04_19010 [Rhizobium sp. Root708]|nr:hypothetical protein ASE04_19010 [Rhizobium sp. Root708]
MTGNEETLVTEPLHKLDAVDRLLSFRRSLAVGFILRLERFAEAPKIGTDDGEIISKPICDGAPGHVRAGVPMQQEKWWTRAAMAHPQGARADINHLQLEIRKHKPPEKLEGWALA